MSSHWPGQQKRKNLDGRISRSQVIRNQLLRDWRGYDDVDSQSRGIMPASALVNKVLHDAKLTENVDATQLRAAWEEIAGEFVSKHSEPVSFENGYLMLRVTQPTMRFHLEQIKPVLFRGIEAKLGKGKIKSIQFTLG